MAIALWTMRPWVRQRHKMKDSPFLRKLSAESSSENKNPPSLHVQHTCNPLHIWFLFCTEWRNGNREELSMSTWSHNLVRPTKTSSDGRRQTADGRSASWVTSCLFLRSHSLLALLSLKLWRWRHDVHPTRQTLSEYHGVTIQHTNFIIWNLLSASPNIVLKHVRFILDSAEEASWLQDDTGPGKDLKRV
jgi:hypothetical protein